MKRIKSKFNNRAVKMKSSKSLRNITVITDRKEQHESLMTRSRSRQALTSTHRVQTSPYNQPRLPSTCKNKTQLIEYHNHNNYSSVSRGKSRSSSKKSLTGNHPNRKKELDFLCLQRMLNQLKKYLIQHMQIWNFEQLCYQQLIKILWLFRFVSYVTEQQFVKNNEQGELKKVYSLWLLISNKKLMNLRLIVSFVQIIENINIDAERQQSLISSMMQQLLPYGFKQNRDFQRDPQYTFFMKKLDIKRTQTELIVDEAAKQKMLTYFNSFKLCKLRDSGLLEYVSIQEEYSLVSKKSAELADKKRKKIQRQIKEKKPHIENINLLDLLSFRQRDQHNQAPKKPSEPKKKQSITFNKKRELKKEIEHLSRPKMYFEQRKQDDVHFEREQDQFTFHPKINPYKCDGKQKIINIKNVDKVLIRMKEARQLKEEKKIILQKGWSNNAKVQEEIKSRNGKNSEQNKQNFCNLEETIKAISERIEERYSQLKNTDEKPRKYEVSKDYLKIPILYIDVNIEQGKKERIIIYDNDKAEDLARQFGQKHKLPEQTIIRLQTLLQQQMDTVLARIEEENEQDCSLIY